MANVRGLVENRKSNETSSHPQLLPSVFESRRPRVELVNLSAALQFASPPDRKAIDRDIQTPVRTQCLSVPVQTHQHSDKLGVRAVRSLGSVHSRHRFCFRDRSLIN